MPSSFSLNHPQAEFLAVKKKFNAFVGGYRSGKTFVGCVRLWMLAAMYPGIKLGYFAPTYPMISDIFYSTIAEVGELLSDDFGAELTVDINVSRKEVKLLFDGVEYAMVKCRAMENAHRIVGFDINHAQIDEIDTMKREKADAAWKKIIARMSSVRDDYPINTVDFTTTPEGFNFVYDLFVVQTAKDEKMAAHYSLTKASTRKNAKNLPEDYIQSLYDTYPSQLVNAYVDGEFVNLKSGTVYYSYNRNRCRSHEVIKDNEPLFIGQDFNVGKMASTVYVQRPNGWHAVAELCDLFDTPDVVRVITERWKDAGHRIIIYPDASGKNRKSVGASSSDIALLQQAGFEVRAKDSNPHVKDRVLSTVKAFESGKVWVNDALCPNTARGLEQQAYDKNGEPLKDGIIDHMCFHGEQDVYVNGKQMKFKDIPEIGFVMCPDGSWRRYKNGGLIKRDQRMLELTLSNGRIITCTPDHGFITDLGIVVADSIIGRVLCDRESFLIANKSLMGVFTIFVGCISRTMGLGFIGKFIGLQKAKYLMDFTFTILTETGATIIQKTLNCLKQASTRTSTMMGTKEECQDRQLMQLDYGTQAKLEPIGTKSSMKKQSAFSTLKARLFAKFAARNTKQGELDQTCTAAQSAVQAQEENQGLIMRSLFALNAGVYLSETNTRNLYSAAGRAPRVISVKEVRASDSYCLTVPSFGCFELCGVAVSNCDATTYPIVYEMPVVKPIVDVKIKFSW